MANPTSNFGWQMPTSTDLVTDLPADFEVFGQAVDTAMADLKGGTTGQILAKNSNTDMDFVWVANDVGDITAVTASSPLTGGGTSGAITVGIQDATTSVKGAVQLSDSTSTTSSVLAATPTAVKSAYDLASTANTNSNNITMVQQYTATESVLKNISSRVPAAEQLLKQAVYWIDAAQSDNSDQVLDNQGWGGTTMTTQLGSTASADSNDPKFLDFDGRNYAYSPGTTGNYIWTSSNTTYNIAGDLDLRVYLALDDWTPSSEQFVFSRDNVASGGRTWDVVVRTDGTLKLDWYPDGTSASARSATSTVTSGIADGTAKWIRVTLDADNGASGTDIKFFTSNDNLTYTQLGSTVTSAGTTTFVSTTSDVFMMARSDAAAPATGKFYAAQILNGIDGTPVLSVDTSNIASGSATNFVARSGQTINISRTTSGKKIAVVTAPLWLFGTDDYMTVADNALLDFNATDSFSLVMITRQWDTPISNGYWIQKGTGSTSYWYMRNQSTNYTTQFLSVDADGTVLTVNGPTSAISGVLDQKVFVLDRATSLGTTYRNTVAGTSVSTTTTDSLANASSLLIGTDSALSNYATGEIMAVAIFRRALTSTELNTLYNYYLARIGA